MNVWLRRLLVLASIGGGSAGFAVAAREFLKADQNTLYYLVCVVVMIAYAAGIYGGIRLAERERDGPRWLFWFFLAQVPVVTSPVLSYLFWCGATVHVTLGTNGFAWGAFVGSQWQISLLQFKHAAYAFGLNFFALWASWYLGRSRRLKAP